MYPLSVAIPTLNRGRYLADTLDQLLALEFGADEIIVVDQTEQYDESERRRLDELRTNATVTWKTFPRPNLIGAMNYALIHARNDTVLYLDDDVIVDQSLIREHALAQRSANIVSGQIIQPWQQVLPPDAQAFGNGDSENPDAFLFNSSDARKIHRVMAGNLSVNRQRIIELGGFDANFKGVAYRFEAEFAQRMIDAGEIIQFHPAATLKHLKADLGGTSSYGKHYKTLKPSHCVGEYYYLLRCKHVPMRLTRFLTRPFKAVASKFHLKNPWWIPATFISELAGMFWAGSLAIKGPALLKAGDETTP